MPNGIGRVIGKGGSIYEGQWLNSVPSGWGRWIVDDGSYFIGWRMNGEPHGYGKYFSTSGVISQEGLYENGKLKVKEVKYSLNENYA